MQQIPRPFDSDELEEEETKAILVLGILASIAVGFQLDSAHSFPFIDHLGAPPVWVRVFEILGLVTIVYFFVLYLGFLTLTLAFRPKGKWLRRMKFWSGFCFKVGAIGLALGLCAYALRVFL
ncbi:MAG: hypothetical protein JRM72_01460 [Nitrososphaerota archaeon]|nr:hypothetical protein [Nitrososphaerota archaeon]